MGGLRKKGHFNGKNDMVKICQKVYRMYEISNNYIIILISNNYIIIVLISNNIVSITVSQLC